MALIICPECGKEISDKAEKCSGCGCPIKHKKSKSAKKLGKGTIIGGLLGIVVFVIVVIVLVLFLLKDSDDTPLKKAETVSYPHLRAHET